MKVIHCGFQPISTYEFRTSVLRKGRRLYNAGHIGSVREESTESDVSIYGSCLPQTSINKPTYELTIKLGPNRDALKGHCTCKAGVDGQCKHVVALVIYINEFMEEACTNQKQSWGIPLVKEGYSKGKKLNEMFPRSIQEVPTPKKSIEDIFKNFADIHCPLKTTIWAEKECETEIEVGLVLSDVISKICENELSDVLTALLSKTTDDKLLHAYKSEDCNGKLILRRMDFFLTTEEKIFMKSFIEVSYSQIVSYTHKTVLQSQSELWHEIRRVRISSSKGHSIVTRKQNFEKLTKTLLSNNFKGNEATHYGNKMEAAARASFQFRNKVRVMACGVVINHDFPWLCASPDGLILSSKLALLEIKCPHSRRGLNIVDRESMTSHVPYLSYNGENWLLKTRHKYFTQIQLSLFTLKLDKCFLYVYSAVDQIQVEVNLDLDFLSEYIPKLEMYYYSYFIKQLCAK